LLRRCGGVRSDTGDNEYDGRWLLLQGLVMTVETVGLFTAIALLPPAEPRPLVRLFRATSAPPRPAHRRPAGPANVISMALYDKLNFNFTRDIAPIASIMRFPFVMEVHPSVPAKTVPEFMAYAEANPGKLNMASAGTGTATHLTGELFKMMTGLNILHVPYRGAGPALIDMIGGQVQLMFDTVPGSIEHIRAGRLRALAVSGAARSDVLPDIPPWIGFPYAREPDSRPRQRTSKR
jgi:hypothetical protein